MIYPLTMFKSPFFTVKPPFFHPVALEAVPAASCHRDALICVSLEGSSNGISIPIYLVGGFNMFNPSEKYESQLGSVFPIYYGK